MTRCAFLCGLIAVFLALCLLPQSPAFAYWKKDGNLVGGFALIGNTPASIAYDSAGGAFVAWADDRSGGDQVYVQHMDSTGNALWTPDGVAVCSALSGQKLPQAVSDGRGGVIVTWQDSRGGSGTSDIYAQRVAASGVPAWTTNGVAVCTASGTQWYPQLVSNGADGAIITWEDHRGGSNGDIYAQCIDSSGTALWTTNGVIVCAELDRQGNPRIVARRDGGVIIVWEDERNDDLYSWGVDIFANWVTTDGYPSWSGEQGIPVCTGYGDQTRPRICTDGYYGAIVTWLHRLPYQDSEVYAQHIEPMGTLGWGQGNCGIAICVADGDQSEAELAPAGDEYGGAIIAWVDQRAEDPGIYAQRVDLLEGNILWDYNGKSVNSAEGPQGYLTICADGAGGAMVAWSEYGTGPDWDIYAQRLVGTSGSIMWGADGVAVCQASWDQSVPLIVTDGKRGTILAWNDYRDDPEFPGTPSAGYIYGARVWAEGSTVGWGTPVSGAVTSNTTWSGAKVASSDLTVDENVTLTLLPGCMIRFAAKEDYGSSGVDSSRCELIVNGTLVAGGSDESLIRLMSASDAPAVGDWRGVEFQAASSDTNLMYKCWVSHVFNGIELTDCGGTVNNCYISGISNIGIKASGSTVTIDSSGVSLSTTGQEGMEFNSGTTGTAFFNVIYGSTTGSRCGIELNGSASLSIEDNTVSGPSIGLRCTGSSTPTVRRNSIENFSGTGVVVSDEADPDLGYGEDGGYNRVIPASKFQYYVANFSLNTIVAEHNWWGTATPSPKKFCCGNVDYTPWLTQDPNQQFAPRDRDLTDASEAPRVAQSYPNPANPQAVIAYTVGNPGAHVAIGIYDISGRCVKTLVDAWETFGDHNVAWNGKNEHGESVASGVYFYEVRIGDFRVTKKLVLVR